MANADTPADEKQRRRILSRRFVVSGLRVFGVLLFIFAILGGYGYYWFDRNILQTLPSDLSSLREWRPPISCQVYDAAGVLVDEFYLERRMWIHLDELPPHVKNAFVAAEDRRFYEHQGIDLLGIVRAFWVNLQSGTVRQGGSTITQQLVKNILNDKARSYQRKLREAVLAWRLEKELSKDEILEVYINYVYLGSGNYGVEAAARDYFGVPAALLDAGQAALLAGLVPAPSVYAPARYPDRAKRRREIVLMTMEDAGFIGRGEASRYLDDPASYPVELLERDRVGVSYVTQVRRELRAIYGSDVAVQVGLKVYTPLDQRVQAVAEEAVQEALLAHTDRQGHRSTVKHLARPEWEAFLARAPGLRRDPATGAVERPERGDCFDALVGDPVDLDQLRAGPWRFALNPLDRQARIRVTYDERLGRPPSTERLESSVQAGDVLRVCQITEDTVGLDPRPSAEGAALVMENATGRILALVGGYQSTLEGFVRATQARRQPGSSFKPYVYTQALLQGRTQLDVVVDSPLSLPGAAGRRWAPKNYGGRYFGPITIRRALAKSLNSVAIRLLLEVGADAVVSRAAALGVRSPLRADPTLALGSSEVTLLDQVRAYSALARMGIAMEPVYIDKVIGPKGRVIGVAGRVVPDANEDGDTDWPLLPGPSPRRALPAAVSYEIVDMMGEVVRAGTARRAFKRGYERAGKTGTTNNNVDAWFVGFTPRYTVGVWVGTDGNESLGDKETGGRAALPAWISIVEALPASPDDAFPVPDDAVLVESEGQWVGLVRGSVPAAYAPYRDPGRAPLPALTYVATATTAS
ncbi:MAG: PBP1A family penicillin-binding protein [Deltaproteobacteria bacterium]|nr:PBP1A family penicillin-binding protein [Deltaproteobacteria bacterium]